MIKAYKYKLNPTKAQETLLSATLDNCRYLYNCALEQRIRAFKHSKASLNYYDQANTLKEVKEHLPEYKNVHSQVLQDVLKRLDKAYKAFYRRLKLGDKAGFPRFQGKHRFNSFTFPQYKQEPTKTVYIPKIGNVRIKLSREILGRIKTLTIKRDNCGDWFAIFTCDNVALKPLAKTGLRVGIDRGIASLIAKSDEDEPEPAPKYFSKSEKALRKAQRRLARRKKGSRNREKARLAVAKIHRKIARQRADYTHKKSTELIQNYDVIVLEDLNTQGMVRSNLSKHILDAGWTMLLNQLMYKAEYAGRQIKSINPAYTSQTCSKCGHVAKENRKSQSKFKCTKCSYESNADCNAARNILVRAELIGANVKVSNLCVA